MKTLYIRAAVMFVIGFVIGAFLFGCSHNARPTVPSTGTLPTKTAVQLAPPTEGEQIKDPFAGLPRTTGGTLDTNLMGFKRNPY